MTHRVVLTPPARRSLNRLPEKVRDAALTFILGPLADNPRRVGHPLREPFADQHTAYRADYRVTYRIRDEEVLVEVVRVAHRSEIYHS